ncbi:MAG: hypothetical protein ACKOEO_25155, partial [Planctomycetaceae bacterium]
MFVTGLLLLIPAVLPAQDAPASAESAGVKTEAVAVAAATEQEPVVLRYRFAPGQVLRYRSEQKMTLEAQLGQSRRVDVSEVKQTRKFTVQSVRESGDAELSMQFEHVWMRKQVDDGAPLDFDSGMKPSEVPETFKGVAHSLRGSAPKFHLTPLGQTAVRSEVQQVAGESRASLPSPVDAEEGPDEPVKAGATVQRASAGGAGQGKDPG